MPEKFLGYILPKDGGHMHGSRFVEPLSDKQYAEFESVIRVTSILRPFIIDFLGLEENFRTLNRMPKEMKERFEAQSNPMMEGAIGAAWRLWQAQNAVSNFLYSSSALRDRSETRLRERFGKDSAQLTALQAAITAAYDGAIEYRLLYNLRNYAQHHDLPLSLVPVKSTVNEQSKIEAYISIVVAPSKLASSTRVQKKFVDQELSKLSEDIDINAYAEVYFRLHAGFLKTIIEMYANEINEMQAYREAVEKHLKLPHGAFPIVWEGDFPMEPDISVQGKFSHFSFDELDLIFVLHEHLGRIVSGGISELASTPRRRAAISRMTVVWLTP
jgi:hypothetical protein